MKILQKNRTFHFCSFFIFRKFVTKNRAFGNNTIFLQHFFGLGGISPFPLATPLHIGIGDVCDIQRRIYNEIQRSLRCMRWFIQNEIFRYACMLSFHWKVLIHSGPKVKLILQHPCIFHVIELQYNFFVICMHMHKPCIIQLER